MYVDDAALPVSIRLLNGDELDIAVPPCETAGSFFDRHGAYLCWHDVYLPRDLSISWLCTVSGFEGDLLAYFSARYPDVSAILNDGKMLNVVIPDGADPGIMRYDGEGFTRTAFEAEKPPSISTDTVNISHCDASHAAQLCSLLMPPCDGIRELVIDGPVSEFLPETANLLSDLVTRINKFPLRVFKLQNVRVIEEEAVICLMEAFASVRLERLTFINCALGCVGAAIVAQYMPRMHLLRRLTLRDCNIRVEGCRAIARSLPSSNIDELNLSKNKLGDGLNALADVIGETKIQYLKLKGSTNYKTATTVSNVWRTLKHMGNVKCLGITRELLDM